MLKFFSSWCTTFRSARLVQWGNIRLVNAEKRDWALQD